MSSKIGVFRYFLPGLDKSAVTPQEIAARGLADRLGDLVTGQASDELASVQISNVRGGPEGDGALIVPMPPDGSIVERAGYYADGQKWVRSDRYWIGTDDAHHPTPSGLARPRLVRGFAEKLGDGQVWECPTVRAEIMVPRVPCSYGVSGGQVFGRVLPQYQDVWERSVKWCVRFLPDYRDHRMVDLLGVREAIEAAVMCLGLNYRIGAEEATLLMPLLDDEALEKVIDAAIDMPTYRALCADGDQKKSASYQQLLDDFQNSLRSPGVSIPDTPPAEPTLN